MPIPAAAARVPPAPVVAVPALSPVPPEPILVRRTLVLPAGYGSWLADVERSIVQAELQVTCHRRVVERLAEWAAAASAPSDDGPIDVTYPDGRTARIVVTARDVAEMYVVQGTLDQIMLQFADSLRSLPDDMPYLVYGRTYDLVPSTEPVLRRRDPADR